MGGRGASKGGGGGASGVGASGQKTDEQMTAELEAHFKDVNELLDRFMAQNPSKAIDLDDMDNGVLDGTNAHIELHTVKDLRNTYIDDFNDNVSEYGDGFEIYDGDQVINVLYKDGKSIYVSPDFWDGAKKIPTSNIDSIIIESGWGTAVAGKNVKLYNWRQEVDYGEYGYKSVKGRYDDPDDIRADFK